MKVRQLKAERKRKTLADSDTREDMIIDVLSDIIVRDLERDEDTAPTTEEQSRCRGKFKRLIRIAEEFENIEEAKLTPDGAYHPHPRYEDDTTENTTSTYRGDRDTDGLTENMDNNM